MDETNKALLVFSVIVVVGAVGTIWAGVTYGIGEGLAVFALTCVVFAIFDR